MAPIQPTTEGWIWGSSLELRGDVENGEKAAGLRRRQRISRTTGHTRGSVTLCTSLSYAKLLCFPEPKGPEASAFEGDSCLMATR